MGVPTFRPIHSPSSACPYIGLMTSCDDQPPISTEPLCGKAGGLSGTRTGGAPLVNGGVRAARSSHSSHPSHDLAVITTAVPQEFALRIAETDETCRTATLVDDFRLPGDNGAVSSETSAILGLEGFKGRRTSMPKLMRKSAGLVVTALLASTALAPAVAQTPPPSAYARTTPAAAPAQIVLRRDQADLLRRTLDEATIHGFERGEFTPRGNTDAALIDATLRYARAVKTGRLEIANFREDWGLRPTPFDARGGLSRAVADDRLDPWLKSLPPPYPGYEVLQDGLANYRAIAERGGWKSLADGPKLEIGSSGPAVEALRARLAAEDPTTPSQLGRDPAGQPVFDVALAESVKRAQKRMGLQQDGVVGPGVRSALNTPVQRRIDQIVANMERWRWLPATLPANRVQVNVAAGVLTLFKNDQPSLSMRAVTGKPNGGETPLLSSEIHSIVLNPPWTVPTGIANRELRPRGAAYLANNGFRELPGGMLQQKPGPGSALGLLKFDFNNPYAVYLHDTPSKGGFARESRLASHGCVRLEKPMALARALLAGDAIWTPEAIDETIAGGKTTRAPLENKVAVFLLYWTAYVTPDGQVNFRQDPYGWDTLLIQRIAAQKSVA